MTLIYILFSSLSTGLIVYMIRKSEVNRRIAAARIEAKSEGYVEGYEQGYEQGFVTGRHKGHIEIFKKAE